MAIQVKCDNCSQVVQSGDDFYEVSKSDGPALSVAQYHTAIQECSAAAQQLPQTTSGAVVIKRQRAI